MCGVGGNAVRTCDSRDQGWVWSVASQGGMQPLGSWYCSGSMLRLFDRYIDYKGQGGCREPPNTCVMFGALLSLLAAAGIVGETVPGTGEVARFPVETQGSWVGMVWGKRSIHAATGLMVLIWLNALRLFDGYIECKGLFGFCTESPRWSSKLLALALQCAVAGWFWQLASLMHA
jgi:hypothetical protein